MGSKNTDSNDDIRVILHFDVDAMYVACEREINSQLRDVPVAVSQYNPYGDLKETTAADYRRRLLVEKGLLGENKDAINGSLIAVSYEARSFGVKRNDRGREAVKKCPTLSVVQVPVKRGKADLTLYRTASSRVMKAVVDSIRHSITELSKSFNTQISFIDSDTVIRAGKTGTREFLDNVAKIKMPVEIASIDEVYVDVTEACCFITEAILKDKSLVHSCQNSILLHGPWKHILDVASKVTTVAGLETQSSAALSINSLRKDEVRKGSHLQVIAVSNENNKSKHADKGSLDWWNRPLSGWSRDEILLAIGAYLASQARSEVRKSFDGGVFTLSGGISSNKTLAKLASGLKKPNQQTLIHRENSIALKHLFHPLPLDRIRGLGGKLGIAISEKLMVTTLGELAQIPFAQLSNVYPNEMARFLFDIGQGICHEPVTDRTKPKGITCGKTFRGGKLAIDCRNTTKQKYWTDQLCGELRERVTEDQDSHNRIPKLLAVTAQFSKAPDGMKNSTNRTTVTSHTKSGAAPRSIKSYSTTCFDLLQKLVANITASTNCSFYITGLTFSATSFMDVAIGSSSIAAAFQRVAPKMNRKEEETQKAKSTPKKPAPIDKWLTSCSEIKRIENGERLLSTSIQTSGSTFQYDIFEKQQHKRVRVPSSTKERRINSFLVPKSATAKRQKTHLSVSNDDVTAKLAAHRVDEAVWNELPQDIKTSLLKELGIKLTRKSRGIASFFEPVG